MTRKKKAQFPQRDPEFLAKIGSIGGMSGAGAKKRRGNSEYYRQLALKNGAIRRYSPI